MPADAVVDDVAEDQRVDRAEHRVDGHEAEEQREHLLVAERELEHALDDPGVSSCARTLGRDATTAPMPMPPPRIIGPLRPHAVEERERWRAPRSRAANTSSAASHGRLDAAPRAGVGVSARAPSGGRRDREPHDEAGGLERLDGGGRARHDAEPGGDLRHPGRPAAAIVRRSRACAYVRPSGASRGHVAAELRRDAGNASASDREVARRRGPSHSTEVPHYEARIASGGRRTIPSVAPWYDRSARSTRRSCTSSGPRRRCTWVRSRCSSGSRSTDPTAASGSTTSARSSSRACRSSRASAAG